MGEPLRAIDTNVVLRYLLQDNLDQWEKAARLIDSDEPVGLTQVALAEIAWTLTGPRYRRERAAVALLMVEFLSRENVIPIGFDKAEAQAALMACAAPVGAADFGDALITASARSSGVHEIYTFDQRFARAGLTPVPL